MSLDEIAREVLKPLELKLGKERDWEAIKFSGIVTATYPLFVPVALGAGVGGHLDDASFYNIVISPYSFFAELISPSVKYFQIGNFYNLTMNLMS